MTQETHDAEVRLAQIRELAISVFGSEEKADRWLNKPLKQLDGRSALEIVSQDPNSSLVEELLNQIDAGFFA